MAKKFLDAQQVEVDAQGNLGVSINAGSISVSGTDGAILDGVDSGIKATVLDLGASNPLTTRIVDSSGNGLDPASEGTLVSVDTNVGSIMDSLTDNTQKTQIVDSLGNAVTVTGNKLDVNASIDTTGLALAANQQTDALTDAELRATAVPVSGTVAVTQSGTWDEVGINDSGNSITVDATDLDIRNLSSAQDSVAVVGTVVADTGNSTTTPLAGNATFTGTGFDMDSFASWSVTIFADQASAANGLKVQWSNDNSNWDFVDQQTFTASVGNMITFGRKANYVRLVYTNGATPQGAFRVSAFAQPFAVRQTRKFVGNQIVDQDTGQVVIAALQGHTTAGGGAWVDVKVNPSGALTVDATATDLDIRNLTATDVVTVTGGAGQTADVKITLDSESVAVTNAGLTELAAAINGSSQMDVNLAASNATVTVSATDLDIRNLTSTDVVSTVPSGFATATSDRKVTVSAGTAVQLASQACKRVDISALYSNTNMVYIGGSTVLGTLGSEKGNPLSPGQTTTLEVTNTNVIYLDSLVSGEGISYTSYV